MNAVDQRIKLLKTKNFTYPYVVAAGRECATTKGDILLFQTLAAAIACRDSLNEGEQNYRLKANWEVKRLDVRDMAFPSVFFEELIDNQHIPTRRDETKRDNMNWWKVSP